MVRTSFHHLTPCLNPSLTPCLTLRRRAAGSLSAALGLALLACGAGCETKPSATPATQAAGPASGTPTAAPTGAVPPPPAAPRRERAGIEVEGTPRPTLAPALAPTHREPAAELVAVPAASVAPPATTGPDADKAASALAFVRGPWLTAVQGLDGPAFAALLTDGFQVSLPPADDGTPRTVGRAEWAAARTPPLGSAATVLIGSPDVRIEEEPDPRTVVSFEERVETASGCQLLDRTLALHEGDGGWRVGTDDASNARECPANTPADVVKALRALASAAATDDPDKIHLHTTSGLRLRDVGLAVAEYSVADLSEGPGRWLLELLAGAPASESSIRLVGDEAIVRLNATTELVLRRMGGAWRLAGVDRAGGAVAP